MLVKGATGHQQPQYWLYKQDQHKHLKLLCYSCTFSAEPVLFQHWEHPELCPCLDRASRHSDYTRSETQINKMALSNEINDTCIFIDNKLTTLSNFPYLQNEFQPHKICFHWKQEFICLKKFSFLDYSIVDIYKCLKTYENIRLL